MKTLFQYHSYYFILGIIFQDEAKSLSEGGKVFCMALGTSQNLLLSSRMGWCHTELLECSLKLSNSQTLQKQKPYVDISFCFEAQYSLSTLQRHFFQVWRRLSAWVYISDIIARCLFSFYLDDVTRTREEQWNKTTEHILL